MLARKTLEEANMFLEFYSPFWHRSRSTLTSLTCNILNTELLSFCDRWKILGHIQLV